MLQNFSPDNHNKNKHVSKTQHISPHFSLWGQQPSMHPEHAGTYTCTEHQQPPTRLYTINPQDHSKNNQLSRTHFTIPQYLFGQQTSLHPEYAGTYICTEHQQPPTRLYTINPQDHSKNNQMSQTHFTIPQYLFGQQTSLHPFHGLAQPLSELWQLHDALPNLDWTGLDTADHRNSQMASPLPAYIQI